MHYVVFSPPSSVLNQNIFECNNDSGDRRNISQWIATCGCGVDERVAVHHARDLRGGHEGTNGHYTATESFRRSHNIGYNVPMLNAPQFTRASHACLYFVSDQ